MENQHRKINGYRELGEMEIALMNSIKDQGNALGVAIKAISDLRHENVECLSSTKICESEEALANAEHHLKTGIMWLVRSVALPDSF